MGAYINSMREKDYIDNQTKKRRPPAEFGNKTRPSSNKIVTRPQKSFKDMTKEEYESYLASVRGV